jgi:hypothetical protein
MHSSQPGDPLFPSRLRMQITVTPQTIRTLVGDAAAKATGVRMSPSSLASSRAVAAQQAGTPLALYAIGYAPTW